MVIQDILFKNFDGTSLKYDPIVGTLVCSSKEVGYPPPPSSLNAALIWA
jgi:hypothetical protein